MTDRFVELECMRGEWKIKKSAPDGGQEQIIDLFCNRDSGKHPYLVDGESGALITKGHLPYSSSLGQSFTSAQ